MVGDEGKLRQGMNETQQVGADKPISTARRVHNLATVPIASAGASDGL